MGPGRVFACYSMSFDGAPLIAYGAGMEEVYALDVDFP